MAAPDKSSVFCPNIDNFHKDLFGMTNKHHFSSQALGQPTQQWQLALLLTTTLTHNQLVS